MKNCSKVKQIDIVKGMKVKDLVNEMSASGVFGAGRISRASSIMHKMFDESQCKVFFGLAGAMVPAGMKNIVVDMLESGKIDVFVATGANLTHDLIEALGYNHFQGTCSVDDKVLNKKNIDRIYESFMPNEVYEGLEDFFVKIFADMPSDVTNIKDFLWYVGSRVPKNKKSILRSCYEKKIPVFCPALADSGIGLMVWGHIAKGKKLNIDAFADMKQLMNICFDCKKAGVIYIGGGVPKNFIQQSLQLTKGASYAVQITMDRPEPGGSSGAELREGISWGKLNAKADYVEVICDATIALPLIWAAVK